MAKFLDFLMPLAGNTKEVRILIWTAFVQFNLSIQNPLDRALSYSRLEGKSLEESGLFQLTFTSCMAVSSADSRGVWVARESTVDTRSGPDIGKEDPNFPDYVLFGQ